MKKVFWIDENNNKYKSDEISDEYLLIIIKYISMGGGYLFFLNERVIDDIYDEALIRGLKPKTERSELKNKYNERKADYYYTLIESLNNEH